MFQVECRISSITFVIKVACVWFSDVLNLVDVMAHQECWELESVEAMLTVGVHMAGEAKPVLRCWLSVTFEDNSGPPLVTMVSTMIARLTLLIFNHNLTFLIHKRTGHSFAQSLK